MANTLTVFQKATARDPSHTTVLRNAFARAMKVRFRNLAKILSEVIADDDVFGLTVNNSLQINRKPGPGAFNFPRSSDKIAAFMKWLQQQVQDDILQVTQIEQVGTAVDAAWTNIYIQDSYKRGIARARAQIRGVAPALTETGGIGASLMNPFHADRLGLLYTRVFNDLKGITDAMDQQISRVLSQGMADGLSPTTIARQLTNTITGTGGGLGVTDTLGRFIPAQRRAEMLARTEIIRAHAEAQLQEFENWRIEGVSAKAEFRTAGDERVCQICAGLQGKIMTIAEARGVIPVHPRCFVDPQIKIYTSKGWKAIGKIKIGDFVLTHKRRFKKVYALPRQNKQRPDVVKIYLHGMRGGGKYLSITANHPVMTYGEIWKNAGELTINDKIMLLANRCHRCDKLIPYYHKYCSVRCNSLEITKRQWANPNHRKLVSEKNSVNMLHQYATGKRDAFKITKNANKKFRQLIKEGKIDLIEQLNKVRHLAYTPATRKASSERMKLNNPMNDPSIVKKAQMSVERCYHNNPEKRLNARMAKLRKSNQMTYIEKRMSDLLDKLGINYIYQYPILRYDVDFAIPALKIAIECDGEFWHKDKQKDEIRQKRIENEGWFVLRYTGVKINQCLDEIALELKRVVMNHNGEYEFMSYPIKKIERYSAKKNLNLFNLSVEEDESYIAKGIIVHNCRCVWIPFIQKRKR